MSKDNSTSGSKDILDIMFGSKIRVKVLKFLFRNYPSDFSISEVAERIQESYADTKKEIETLGDIKLIKNS